MIQRFKAVAGFLAAASLLSGSAFAFAPEFGPDLPTVIITDELSTGTPGLAYDNNGAPAATTEFTFRFTKAFALLDYLDLQGNDPDDTKLLFNEFDDFSDTTPNTIKTLMINGQQAFATGLLDHPSASDVDTQGVSLTARYLDGGLDFRNIDFSGTNEAINAGFNEIGDNTGDDILASDQQRVVHLYVKGDTDNTLAGADFLVITSHGGLDSIASSTPSNPQTWTEVIHQELLSGWNGGALGDVFLIPSSGTTYDIMGSAGATSGYTFTPNTNPTSGSQQTVGLAVNDAMGGFGRWSKFVGPLSANQLYRLRANVYSPNAASRETFRLGFGDAIGGGQSLVQFDDVSALGGTFTFPQMSANPNTELKVYLAPEIAIADAEIVAEVVVLSNTSTPYSSAGGGQDFVLDEITVELLDQGIAGLGSVQAVVLNHGGAVVDGDTLVDPVPGQTGFDTSSSIAGSRWLFSNGLNSSNQETLSASASALTVNFPANTPPKAPPDFVTLALQDANGVQPWLGGAFQVDAASLYQVDVWASSTTNNTTASSRADLRIDISMNAGHSAHYLKDLSAVNLANQNIGGLTTTPRAYTLFFQPQGGAATLEAQLALRLLSIEKNYPTASQVTINRVTIREYVAPE